MPNVFDGRATESGEPVAGRFAIVVSRYNESITQKLLDGAIETLKAAGVADDAIDVAWVPGAFELPVVAEKMTDSLPSAVICLGCVIRGETTHDEHINRAVSYELARIGVETGVPVMFGVLTCQNLEQAIHRSGGSVGNKGAECAEAALEMARLLEKLDGVDDTYEC
ncbi:MAG: 6,7-dimethyl-8-ribityllumazine synthase [Pirellulales bacterium]|nr:6,7-dimethyl-8-ribityllumazine synthase [Pirellulales bacterium]